MTTLRLILAVVFGALLGGCATPPPPAKPAARVVLLPGPDGQVGKLAVTTNGGETVLSTAYGVAGVDTAGQVKRSTGDEGTVRRDFAAALAALPPRPVSHVLYFEHDSDTLTADSLRESQAILDQIAARPVADIIIIGHTDTVGEGQYNDQLSLQRAHALRDALIRRGGDAARIGVAGRGEREPLITTADERHEPKNRRAEISVR